MNAVEVEVCGGPDDGMIITVPGGPSEISWPLFPAIEATITEPGEMPVIRTITFTIHRRADGRHFINYWEGTT